MAKVKVVFFVPLLDNDGRDLAHETSDLQVEIFDTFVAFTRSGLVTGAYLMADGRRADDELWSYFVVLEEERVSELREIIARFKAKTTQEWIYFELQYNTFIKFV